MTSYEIGYLAGFLRGVQGNLTYFNRSLASEEATTAYWKYLDRVTPLTFDDFKNGYTDGVQACCKQEKLVCSGN